MTAEDTADLSTADRRAHYAEIFLVSFAALLLEISYTRVISFKLFYYYTYFVIGLALLGIGCGGVLVTVSNRLRRAATDTILIWSLLLGALSVALGYVVLTYTSLDTFAIWHYGTRGSFKNLALLLLIAVALFAPFIAVGVIVSTLLGRHPEKVGRLYFADLVGAGLALAIVIALLNWIGPPGTIFLAGAILAVAGLRIMARRGSPAIVVATLLIAALAVSVIAPIALPDPKLETSKADQFPSNAIYSKWNPIFRVDVFQFPGKRTLYHDGLVGSSIYQWDGKNASLKGFGFDTDLRALPFATLGSPPRNDLIIGAAGGHEVLTSLYFKAGHTDAVELNPATYSLITDRYASYAGHLATHPTVNYVNGDGRSYLARSSHDYKLIWYPAPDSYATGNAATAGAFVLSESYLYTTNALKDSFKHLEPGGIVTTQFGEVDFDKKPNRTTRYVSTARAALADVGVHDPSSHILVATTPSGGGGIFGGSISTILVKRSPFTAAEVAAFVAKVHQIPGSIVRYAPGHPQFNSVTKVATASSAQLDSFYGSYPYNVKSISDDDPFFWHFRTFGNVIRNITHSINNRDREDTVGERVLLLLLAIAALLAAVFLLLPFFAIRKDWHELPLKGRSAVFFASLGFGFIFFEVTLIQRLTLFLGYPTYSITVTLMSLLVFLGVGAFLSPRLQPRAERALPRLALLIAALTAFYLFGLPHLTDAALGLPLAARVPIAFVVLAPLGMCLGLFMPLGLGAVADLSTHPTEYVAWGWAVNGFASVIGSVLATILAMTFGFHIVLVVALAIYLLALMSLRSLLGARRAAVA
ncbi:MAG TPA: hypothetical protein VLV81_02540 [Acidimicrobiia bacterium]|nr:hypothetical protein [Acidimicrobiia bacterium]